MPRRSSRRGREGLAGFRRQALSRARGCANRSGRTTSPPPSDADSRRDELELEEVDRPERDERVEGHAVRRVLREERLLLGRHELRQRPLARHDAADGLVVGRSLEGAGADDLSGIASTSTPNPGILRSFFGSVMGTTGRSLTTTSPPLVTGERGRRRRPDRAPGPGCRRTPPGGARRRAGPSRATSPTSAGRFRGR